MNHIIKQDQEIDLKISFPKGRVFIFIDETGDPGQPENKSSSRYFQLNITVIHRDSLHSLNRHLSAFRYFKNSGRELKRHARDFKILSDIFIDLAHQDNVLFTSFILEKEKYVRNSAIKPNSNQIRNHIVKVALEYIFIDLIDINMESNNIEIVFDRYLESEKDEEDLKSYIRKNYKLPKINKIVQIDSEYSESLQISDFLGRFVKNYFIDGNTSLKLDLLDFIKVFIIKDSCVIKAKSAQDTQ